MSAAETAGDGGRFSKVLQNQIWFYQQSDRGGVGHYDDDDNNDDDDDNDDDNDDDDDDNDNDDNDDVGDEAGVQELFPLLPGLLLSPGLANLNIRLDF